MLVIKKSWNQILATGGGIFRGDFARSLTFILIAAALWRLIAVLFAKGYGMHDDHFLVLEWAQSWLDGETIDKSNPAGHSLVYPGLHYLLLLAFKSLGWYNPDFIMYIVRFLHAALSIATVYFGYKTALMRTSPKVATEIGLLLAVFWLFPFMSVRNLIEMVCVPFLVMGAYWLVRYEDAKLARFALIAGMCLGLSFTFRYQTSLFIAGFAAVMLFRKDIVACIMIGIGFLASSFLVQGITDWIVYGYPYASFLAYYAYNSAHGNEYTTGAWFVYFFTIMGILIPPTSLLIMYGFALQWKRWALLFWPTMLFLAVHSIYPNKQERFILPAVPFLLMAGIAGWHAFAARSPFWRKHPKFHAGLWKWFWAVNIVLLVMATTTYSKRARVEVMNFLHAKNDATAIIVETSDASAPMLPSFYLGKNIPIYCMTSSMAIDSVRAEISRGTAPNYLVMMNHKRMEERNAKLDSLYPSRMKIAEISPSPIDQLLHVLNPKHNVNQKCYVFRITGIPASATGNKP